MNQKKSTSCSWCSLSWLLLCPPTQMHRTHSTFWQVDGEIGFHMFRHFTHMPLSFHIVITYWIISCDICKHMQAFAFESTPARTHFFYLVSTHCSGIWGFPKMGVPPNGWFIMENPIKMGWFGGTPILGNLHIFRYTWTVQRSMQVKRQRDAFVNRPHPQINFPTWALPFFKGSNAKTMVS